ncbi:hypothetical protein Agub_g9778, partial [Astrephomene gubernaculifera]
AKVQSDTQMYGGVRNGAAVLARVARATRLASLTDGHDRLIALAAQDGSRLAAIGSLGSPLSGWGLDAFGGCSSVSHMTQQVAAFASKGGGKHGKGKDKHGGGNKGSAAAATSGEADVEAPPFDLSPFDSDMSTSLAALSRELAGIRTGRASPGLLEAVEVEASSRGGVHVPLRALGTVVARNPQLLVVELYDKEDAPAVAAAIEKGPLKLQARVEGNEVMVAVPRLSMDMVERMIRLAGQEAEHARAAVRRVRHRAMDFAKKSSSAGGVGHDEGKRREQEVQALTDRYIREIDSLLKAKEKNLRENH